MSLSTKNGPADAPAPDRSKAERARPRRVRSTGRRRKVPTVLQMESVECGAAALSMILARYGRHVPLEELRADCGVSRDGARASSLVAVARRHGLIARGYQTEAAALPDQPMPLIVFWAFQHFLVVEGISRRFGRTVVHVNDPAAGPRTMDWDEFDSGYTGIALTFEPGPDFAKAGRAPRVLDALAGRRQPTGRALPLILLASLLLVPIGIVGPACSRVFLDQILGEGDHGLVLPLLLTMTAAAVGTTVLTAVQQHYLLRIETRMGVFGSARFFRHLLRLPVDFFLQRQPAEVARRVSANDMVAQILNRDLATTVVNLLLVFFYAAVLFRYDMTLGTIGIALATLNIGVLRLVARTRTDAVSALRADRGKLTGTTFNTLRLIETIKATGAEQDAFARWAGFLAKTTSGRQRLGLPTAFITVIPPMLATANTGLILLVGGLRVVDGAISVGTLVAFQTLLNSFSRPVAQLTNLGEQLQDAAADLARLHDVERYPVDPAFEQRVPAHGEARLSGHVAFEEITFGYNPQASPILNDVSLTVEPGRRIALVGGSGSGKSSLGRLVAGLYRPWSGRILMDGRPREGLGRELVAASVAFVDQDISLFEGTVRDNLTLWDETIPDEAVTAALRDAEIFDLVAARPGGIRSGVLESGRNFSGGQRQRLELARALVTRPTLLVLDEATSALDAETEQRISDNLRRRGCACLIIAHRLSSIRDADEIIVLEHGEVVERGRHYELMDRDGRYRRLVAADDGSS
jgi:NHLM bacteriocin system ABC transporter peptidase/ATP-binding protein